MRSFHNSSYALKVLSLTHTMHTCHILQTFKTYPWPSPLPSVIQNINSQMDLSLSHPIKTVFKLETDKAQV